MMRSLIYEDVPKYDLWLKIILGGILAVTFVAGVVLLFDDIVEALAMLGVALFEAFLFKAILPQRFQIFEDGLRIVLGGPFAINIPLSNIREARSASSFKTFAYGGIRFATSTRYVVEIVRKKGLNLVISPASGDMFLEQINQAIADAAGSNAI